MLNKLENLFFSIFIFSIPLQTRIILRSWGIGFNEWNSAFFYFTDLLIIFVFCLWFLRLFFKKAIFKISNYDFFLFVFLIISTISIKNSLNPALGFYRILKLTEFSLLYFYLKSNFQFFRLQNLLLIFLFSSFFQSILAILQYIKGSDLGLRILGETVLNKNLFNVATFISNGEKIMRPYGTLPHPNVLAFVLFFSIFIFYFLYFSKSRFANSNIGIFIYGISLFAFFLTFSRIIIFGWLISLISIILITKRKFKNFAFSPKIKKLIFLTIAVSFIFSIIFFPQVLSRLKISSAEEAVILRNFYTKVSFFEKPFFGVGIGNFVNWLKEINPGLTGNIYQPVHNIYLLVFSETGILGLAAFSLFLIFLIRAYFKKIDFNQPFYYSLFIFFATILFFGIFDHFMLTLQQGGIIFWLILGVISAASATPNP